MLSRRHILRLGGGAAVTAWVAGCTSTTGGASPTTRPASTTTSTASTPAPTVGTSRRTLVVVQLNGGNDALNTLVPTDGRYRDARPTLAIPEADLVALPGVDEWTLHPSLAPLGALWDAGSVAFLPGIGFPDPDRSHFVSLDRWWRADELSSPTGWLGHGVADAELRPLYGAALGTGAPVLRSDLFQPAVILQPSGFVFPIGLPGEVLARLTDPLATDPLAALAQRSLGETIAAVEAFSTLLGTDDNAGDEISYREGGVDLTRGLDLAARLVTADVGTRVVVVSVGGFDTHSNQLGTHTELLADLAMGVETFMSTVAAAGRADDTLLVTTSEFGRRIAENASGGFDHGAGGMSMMIGPMVRSGVLSGIDLGDPLDGDVRPTLDPRTMYTACLDWLGLDPDQALGRRYDEVTLLR